MSRVLKFRIRNKKHNTWVYSDFVNDTHPDKKNTIQGHLAIGTLYVSDEEYEIHQFTGLLDKENKEIYEGDILSSEVNEKPCNYIVVWGDSRSDYCGFMLKAVMKNPPRITFHIHDFKLWMAEGFKVIGNVCENPELLYEQKPNPSSTT